ncbi:MAG: alpha-glucosidase (family GH31 glycosyl hydrolase) [Planctomycetota bacterium]|jgi:alpha-glucosidase (family GH31 glycosyl hydrolase)
MKNIFFIPLFFLLACNSDEVKIPSDIISREKIINIYMDVHISDALVTSQRVKDVKKSNQQKKSYLVSVLKKHNVSLEAYEKTNSFYENHQDLMVKLYADVMIKFSEEQALLEGDKKEIKKEEKKK